jgi:hypothetical protein
MTKLSISIFIFSDSTLSFSFIFTYSKNLYQILQGVLYPQKKKECKGEPQENSEAIND